MCTYCDWTNFKNTVVLTSFHFFKRKSFGPQVWFQSELIYSSSLDYIRDMKAIRGTSTLSVMAAFAVRVESGIFAALEPL